MGDAMACETAGGTGVGPAVMRYCLMNGFAVMRTLVGSWGERRRLAAEPCASRTHERLAGVRVRVALEVLAEVVEAPSGGEERDPAGRGEDAEHDADDAQQVAGLRLPAPDGRLAQVDAVAGLRAADPGGDRARQREQEA